MEICFSDLDSYGEELYSFIMIETPKTSVDIEYQAYQADSRHIFPIGVIEASILTQGLYASNREGPLSPKETQETVIYEEPQKKE